MDQMIRPAQRAFAVTPHNSNALTYRCRAIGLGDQGVISYINWIGETFTTSELPPGIHAICATHILATGTTATLITAFAD